jgi:energy-coupling factor transport system permease protein
VAARTRGRPDFVARHQHGPYRSLNPTTKLVVAFAAALIAFGVRGWTAPLVVLGVMIAIAVGTGLGRGFRPYFIVLTPLVISIMLINTFLYPGAEDVLFSVGPFDATAEGLTAASQAALRVIAFAASVGVFALTTRTDELVDDLEQRGLGRRATFVISAAIGTVPRMAERAREIVDAQRARGMDTEGSIAARLRGLVPLAGPLVLGALTDVEQRTMALEARAFAAPGRRTSLRPYPDSAAQRGLRWGLTLLTIVLVVLAVGGWLWWLP